MQHLFTPEGKQSLQTVIRNQPLLAFDFDGTLAPIVPHPHDARIAPAAAQVLGRIAKFRPVAIVTGRRVADVLPRLGFSPHYVIGNHGAEDPARPLDARSTAALDALRRHIADHLPTLNAAGIGIEDKGQSLALHYRLAPRRGEAVAVIEKLLADLDPALTSFGGKCVANITPADAPDKGDAVASLVSRSGSQTALFIGDDVNDESVFERALPHWLTVRIGRGDGPTQAMFALQDQREMDTLLRSILVLLEQPDLARL